MSDRAQRVLDALMDYDANKKNKYPMMSIYGFFKGSWVERVSEDYDALTAEEEKQVIQAFLEFAY